MAVCKQRGKRKGIAGGCAFLAGIFAAAQAAPAFAYLDPGTGSIILQGLIAGLAMAAAAGSMYWRRIKAIFTSVFSRKKPRPTEPNQDPNK